MLNNTITEMLTASALDAADEAADSYPNPFEAHEQGDRGISAQDCADAAYNGTYSL